MNSRIYGKLAITSLKNNRKTYVPYILMAILSVMMYFIVCGMSSGNNGLGETVKMLMNYMANLLKVFSVIFLFYVNSFLIKRRKREIGIYNILGMGKGHIARMLAIETLVTAVSSIAGGILLGTIFGKLMYLVLERLLQYEINLKFVIPLSAFVNTTALFGCIFLLILIYNLIQIKMVSPVELLHGSNQGEREPKTKWLLAIAGIGLLAAGYYIAQTTENPMDAIGKFFIAVLCVVLGTYGVFIAGSIAVLKMLKKNKSYYYKAKHFTAVSGMIYRMKQNAVGLANICILSTMVLVMVSTTVCLYAGLDDIMKDRYPREYETTLTEPDAQSEEQLHEVVARVIKENQTEVSHELSYHVGNLTGIRKGTTFTLDPNKFYSDKAASDIKLIPLDDYNRLEGKNETLKDGEVLVYTTQKKGYGEKEICLNNTKLSVKKEIDTLKMEKKNAPRSVEAYYVVMKDETQIQDILEQAYENCTLGEEAKEVLSSIEYRYAFDIAGSSKTKAKVEKQIETAISDEIPGAMGTGREGNKESFYDLYGSLFFMGIYLGFMFLMVTVLIIYYKQISEGYDDKDRYRIMQQVGMDKREVKKSIRTQVLMVFFLPLAMAVIHVAAAFKVITKMLAIFYMTNIRLFIECTIATIIAFVIIYCAVFVLTEREYYRIVK